MEKQITKIILHPMTKKIDVVYKKQPTDREIELVQLLANEYTVKDIAEMKEKKDRTMEYEVDMLKRAFGCRTTIGLVVLFYRNGLIK